MTWGTETYGGRNGWYYANWLWGFRQFYRSSAPSSGFPFSSSSCIPLALFRLGWFHCESTQIIFLPGVTSITCADLCSSSLERLPPHQLEITVLPLASLQACCVV